MKKIIAALFVLLVAACNPITTISNSKTYPNATMLPPIKGEGRYALAGNQVTLICTIAAFPAFSVAQCADGIAFPYTVPDGQMFCLTHVYLQNKYPWDPPAYSGNMKAVYLQENGGVTASSHHPDLHFDPPIPYQAGEKLQATISSSQTENQNVIVMEQGFLVFAGKSCSR